MFTLEVYDLYKYLLEIHLFKLTVFICKRIITRALLLMRDLLFGLYYLIKNSF